MRIGALLTALLLLSGEQGLGGQSYPSWFLHSTTEGRGRAAVGYSPAYSDKAQSAAEAFEHAVGQLRANRALVVRAEYLQEALPSGLVAYRGERYAEDTMVASPDSIADADTVQVGQMVLVYAATASGRGDRTIRALNARAPSWVSSTPRARQGAFAVGSTDVPFREEAGWLEAERQARRAMAYDFESRTRSLERWHEGRPATVALVASTSVLLRNAEVRERWRDAKRMFVLLYAEPESSK